MPSIAPNRDSHQPLVSELAFKKVNAKVATQTLLHARIFATSKTYGWDGIYAEADENNVDSARDPTVQL